MNVKQQLKEGLITQNPVTVQLLGMCSVLAITTTLFNGIGMGLSVLVILTLSNIFISLLRNIIPSKVRIACYIVVIAGFVTMVDLFLKAFVPALSESLGLFIPLIVVNCIILGRAEGFSSKNGVAASALDGVFQGLGYTMVLVIMCIIREFLGNGTFGGGILNGGEGVRILPENIPALGMILPVGGFLTLACVIAAMQYFLSKPKKTEKKEEVAKYWSFLPHSSASLWGPSWSITLFLPSSWASARLWACPKRWTPLWAWAWPLSLSWAWPPPCAGQSIITF